MKLWGGRFKESTSDLLDEYNASIKFDKKLAFFDIQGSMAHIKMLEKCKIVSQKSAKKIIDALPEVLKLIESPDHEFPLAHEDIHMHVETLLFDLIGEDAGKLHTGRSRNDQVALDMHLYLRNEIVNTVSDLLAINGTLLSMAAEHIDVVMPGYTHLQRAEPIRFSHHLMCYFNMFSRDIGRLFDLFERANVMPLGAGALAGCAYDIDREYLSELLKFNSVYDNSLDAVSNRDHVAEFLFIASLIMMHFSKFSEEIILWASDEFSFIELSDQFATGSSMMPQKKNPDIPELARGKTGRVYGALFGLLTVLKGLPLAYNKDLQEDKEGLFDVVKTLKMTVPIFDQMLASMRIRQSVMLEKASNDYSDATQLANYLVNKGVTFREAHRISGEIVKYALNQNLLLSELSLSAYQSICPFFSQDLYAFLSVERVVEAHVSQGGTSKSSVAAQLMQGEKLIKGFSIALSKKKACILGGL